MIREEALKSILEAEIVRERVNYYKSLLWGDRFDGTPNFDHAQGAEDALRRVAEHAGIEVLSREHAKGLALGRMREAYPDNEDVDWLIENDGDIEYIG